MLSANLQSQGGDEYVLVGMICLLKLHDCAWCADVLLECRRLRQRTMSSCDLVYLEDLDRGKSDCERNLGLLNCCAFLQ
jgi:hypothetical protein